MMPNYHLALQLKLTRFSVFHPLLQQGVRVLCRTGCTLGDLLSEQWGIDAEYVNQRVTTIFLNSRAIDNVATALVGPGATIALSGAMPGLVGATMRRGGYYAAMRGAMTYQSADDPALSQQAEVRVKLFNLLLPELGPGFLRRGIQIAGADLLTLFRAQEPDFWPDCFGAELNGTKVVPATLPHNESLARIDTIRLTVECGCTV